MSDRLSDWEMPDLTPDAEMPEVPSGLQLSVAVEYTAIEADAPQDVGLVFSVTAPPASVERAPVRLVAVLDRSGSMAGPKLELLKASMLCLLQHLTDADALGLVVYDTQVQTLSPLTRCDARGKAELSAQLRSVHAGSSTNLSGGLLKGLDVHESGPEGVVRSTFLFTDGLANVGIKDPDQLGQATQAALATLSARGAGSSLHTFGFGGDHNAELLRALAEVGGGAYAYIEREDGMANAFGEALGGLLSMTHQNVALCVQPAPGVTLCAQTALEVRSEPSGALAVELGDLLCEERRDVLVQAHVAAGPLGSCPLATLRARGFALARGAFVEEAAEARVLRGEVAVPGATTVLQHRNRFTATQAMDAARALGAAGRVAEARATVQSAQEAIGATGASDGITARVFRGLQECAEDLCDAAAYKGRGQKKLAMLSAMHGKQQAVGWDNSYSNSVQRKMKMSFRAFTE